MKTNMWLRLYWTDQQMVWDPADFGGINVLRLPNEDIWNPDIVLLNNADGNFEVSKLSNLVASVYLFQSVCLLLPTGLFPLVSILQSVFVSPPFSLYLEVRRAYTPLMQKLSTTSYHTYIILLLYTNSTKFVKKDKDACTNPNKRLGFVMGGKG